MGSNPVDPRPQPENPQKIESTPQQQFEYLLDDLDFLFHEIRTPLTAVISSAEFLLEQPLTVSKKKTLLDIIRKEAQHIDNLLNDFAEIYNHENSSWLAEISFSPINVGDLLREAIARFRNTSTKHIIQVEVPADLPLARGDAEKLYLVVRNLLANALKYSPSGGKIIVSAAECNREVIVRVRDYGVGIPKECLPNIFDRGFRVNLPECKKTRGSGLGLTMVKRIVEGHNGKIHIESKQGEGSTFQFSLPRLN